MDNDSFIVYILDIIQTLFYIIQTLQNMLIQNFFLKEKIKK